MEPLIAIVKVLCKCGWWITIRGPSRATRICWTCARKVTFVFTGWMRARGYSDGEETKATVTWMGNTKDKR